MSHKLKHSRLLWLAIGLVVGLAIGGLWPHTPLHAVATDRYDTFAIATGPVDEDVEAIFFLDFLTGNLSARVLNQAGVFAGFYEYNVLAHLGVKPNKTPRYLMITGVADIQRAGGSQVRPSRCVVYVAEVNSGAVAAYAVPWNPQILRRPGFVRQPLIPVAITKFRGDIVRQQQ